MNFEIIMYASIYLQKKKKKITEMFCQTNFRFNQIRLIHSTLQNEIEFVDFYFKPPPPQKNDR